MSRAANPNKPKKGAQPTEAEVAAKKQKVERERIRKLLITLGDDNKKVISQVRGVAGALEDDVEMHGDLLTDTLVECAKCLPLKSGMFAAWLAKMAEKNATWSAAVVGKLLDELRASIRTGRTSAAQLLLRFFVCLANYGLISLGSVFQLLQEVCALSEGLRPNKGGDFGVFLALAQLPFLSPAAYKKAKESVNKLIEAAKPYLAHRDPRWKPLLQILKGHELPDRIEALADCLESLAHADWSSQAVQHVPGFEPTDETKPGMPELSLDIKAEELKKTVRLQVPLMSSPLLTSGEEVPEGGRMSKHDRWVLEDYILLTIEMFGKDVEKCSEQVLRIPVLHNDFEAVAVETIFSQMLRLPTPPHLPLFYLRLLEAITEKQATTKKLTEEAYQSLFAHSKALDEESLDVLAEAFAYHLVHSTYQADWKHFTGDSVSVQGQRFIRRTMERLQRLSFHQNLIHRLPEAVHVYVPPEPVAASGLPVVSKPEFGRMIGFIRIKDANENKVMEYCNWLMHLRPKEEQTEPSSAPKQSEGVAEVVVNDDDGNEGDEADAKRRKLNDGSKDASKQETDNAEGESSVKQEANKTQEEEQKDEATATPGKAATSEEFGSAPAQPLPLEEVAEIVAFAMLQQGHKTPTHMSKLLDGNQKVLIRLRPQDEDKAHSFAKRVASCVFDFWRASAQRLEIIMDMLLQRTVVTPRAVIETALSEKGPQGCDSIAVWNIINSIARKSLERSQAVRVELALAKKLGKEESLEKSRAQLDAAVHENAELFTLIFTGLVKNYQEIEDKDSALRSITLQRITAIGRKYVAFIKPLVVAAESRIPGVANCPEVSAVFSTLSTL